MYRIIYTLVGFPFSIAVGMGVGAVFNLVRDIRGSHPLTVFGDLFLGAITALVGFFIWPVIGYRIGRKKDQTDGLPKRCRRCQAILYAHDCPTCDLR